MIENPTYVKYSGSGTLSVKSNKTDVEFQVFLINTKVMLYCNILNKSTNFPLVPDTPYSIYGKTDSDKDFKAIELFLTDSGKELIEFESFNLVIVGDYIQYAADKIEYSFAKLHGLNCDFKLNGFDISIRSEANSIKENISEVWEIPQVAAKIILVKNNTPIDDYKNLIHKIRLLIGLGKGIIPKHSKYTLYSKDKVSTILQAALSHIKSIDPILLNANIPKLLQNGIKEMEGWDEVKLQNFRTIIEYANASNSIYSDDNLLMIFQCLELMGNKWFKIKFELSSELNDLKKKLKKTLADWRNDHENYQDKDFISNRVISALEWERASNLIKQLLIKNNLDINKLHLDVATLTLLRNDVSHEGAFKKENIPDHIDHKIFSAQFTLRVLLLKILNYDGKIKDYRSGGRTKHVPIESFYI